MPRISNEQRLKAEQERLRILTNRNKVRLMDLLFRIERMQNAGVGRAGEISYTLMLHTRVTMGTSTECHGISFTYPVEKIESWNSSSTRRDWSSGTEIIRFDNDETDEYRYELLNEALDKLEEIDREEKAKVERRDAMLRRMSAEERADLGFANWRDPNPDGAAEVLAEQVVGSKPRRRRSK